MAKNRLFGWMFVEDSNKESETVKPRTSQEASAPATVAVPSSVPTPTIMASGDVDTKLVRSTKQIFLALTIWNFSSQRNR